MYAIVRSGGRQHKVAIGDTLVVDHVTAGVGDALSLTPVLVVDGETVTHEADKLAKFRVTAEVLEHTKGRKIRIHKFRNKTGYHKRMGHRQQHTRVKVTGIETGK